MQFRQVIITSHSTLNFNTRDLTNMLLSSLTRNARDNITSLLLVYKQYYMQVIEGSPHNIEDLLTRLRGDSRMNNVTVIRDTMVDHRDFGDWLMGFKDVTTSEISHQYIAYTFAIKRDMMSGSSERNGDFHSAEIEDTTPHITRLFAPPSSDISVEDLQRLGDDAYLFIKNVFK